MATRLGFGLGRFGQFLRSRPKQRLARRHTLHVRREHREGKHDGNATRTHLLLDFIKGAQSLPSKVLLFRHFSPDLTSRGEDGVLDSRSPKGTRPRCLPDPVSNLLPVQCAASIVAANDEGGRYASGNWQIR